MTVQLRLNLTSIIAGSVATAAILVQAPQASARIATASLVGMNSDGTSQAVPHSVHEPCEHLEQSTILNDATASITALGSDSPLAQASVLIAGLGCLVGGSLLLKRNCH